MSVDNGIQLAAKSQAGIRSGRHELHDLDEVGRKVVGFGEDQGFEGYVETAEVLRFALGKKGRKFGYSFITDQSPYTPELNHPTVEFMHQPTQMMTGATALASKLGMAVVYLRYECREEGGYRMTFVPISDNAKGEDPVKLMERYYALLQEDLEKQPWNYLWTHKRWKK